MKELLRLTSCFIHTVLVMSFPCITSNLKFILINCNCVLSFCTLNKLNRINDLNHDFKYNPLVDLHYRRIREIAFYWLKSLVKLNLILNIDNLHNYIMMIDDTNVYLWISQFYGIIIWNVSTIDMEALFIRNFVDISTDINICIPRFFFISNSMILDKTLQAKQFDPFNSFAKIYNSTQLKCEICLTYFVPSPVDIFVSLNNCLCDLFSKIIYI